MLSYSRTGGTLKKAPSRRGAFWRISSVGLDGRIAGSWQREVKGDRVTVRLKLQAAPTASHRRRLSALADTYARFIGRPGAAIEPA